jgi:hypothetical protein
MRVGGFRRRLAAVDRGRRSGAGVMAHEEGAAADSGALRLDDVQRQHGGDGRVGRASALAKDLDARRGRARVGGRHHAGSGQGRGRSLGTRRSARFRRAGGEEQEDGEGGEAGQPVQHGRGH